MKSNQENLKLCDECTICCEHVALEIDTPKSITDYGEILWYVLHENVSVFIDHDGSWNLKFFAKCTALNGNGLCNIHGRRPGVCSNYDQENCEKHGDGESYVHRFNTKDEFLSYLKRKKPNIYRKIK